MRRLWASREIAAPPVVLWELLVDPQRWPSWGPSVRSAEVVDPPLGPGSRGEVTTVGGLRLPFEVTAFEQGRRWSWKVAGLPATDHTVEALGDDRCRVGFGVPVVAAPYLAVCRIALHRLDGLAGDLHPARVRASRSSCRE
jgi:uncharacterized protein YndB with AHSA1/START domain